MKRTNTQGCEGFIPQMLTGSKVQCCGKIATVLEVRQTRGPGIPGWEAFLAFRYFVDARPRWMTPLKDRTDVAMHFPKAWHHFSTIDPVY